MRPRVRREFANMIRVRHPSGTHTYPVAQGDALTDLCTFIHQKTGIAPVNQTRMSLLTVLSGFPPRPIGSATTLADAGIKPGDTVVVKEEKHTDHDMSSPNVVLENGATLALKIVPDDNSCLFNAISYVHGDGIAQDAATSLRHCECVLTCGGANYSE